jgi:polysaccharide deacetylase 2 family uncharacterized protein YibQ
VFFRALLFALTLVSGKLVHAEGNASVAIIIDDLGHSLKKGQAFIDLPASITFAILPHTAHSRSIAESATAANKEVIVHLPMANLKNTPIGPGGLTATQPRVDFLLTLDAAINDVPFAKGINNHTGSYLTQQPQQMQWLMGDMKRRGFYFVDSRTTPNSVARDTAERFGVTTSSRDVFLDNETSFESIDAAFSKLVKKAKENGTAIAIGHPYPETLNYLRDAIPRLEALGIAVLPVSGLIAKQQPVAANEDATMLTAQE